MIGHKSPVELFSGPIYKIVHILNASHNYAAVSYQYG